MDREQAVKYLQSSGFSEEQIKAIEGAFTCDKCVYSTSEGCQYDDITEAIPPFEDCISRQAVIDCFKKWQPYMATRLWEFEQELSALPSVGSSENPNKCEDAISRQAVLEGLRTCYDTETKEYSDGSQWINYEDAVAEMENLPPVTPQQKTGHWIGDGNYICSCCKRDPLDFLEPCGLDGGSYMDTPMKYCPNCGAKMQEVEE